MNKQEANARISEILENMSKELQEAKDLAIEHGLLFALDLDEHLSDTYNGVRAGSYIEEFKKDAEKYGNNFNSAHAKLWGWASSSATCY